MQSVTSAVFYQKYQPRPSLRSDWRDEAPSRGHLRAAEPSAERLMIAIEPRLCCCPVVATRSVRRCCAGAAVLSTSRVEHLNWRGGAGVRKKTGFGKGHPKPAAVLL